MHYVIIILPHAKFYNPLWQSIENALSMDGERYMPNIFPQSGSKISSILQYKIDCVELVAVTSKSSKRTVDGGNKDAPQMA